MLISLKCVIAVALWWHYQNVRRRLTIIPVQQHWLNQQSATAGFQE